MENKDVNGYHRLLQWLHIASSTEILLAQEHEGMFLNLHIDFGLPTGI